MRRLLAVITGAALLAGCATNQEITIDPGTVSSMGASGAGAVALPPVRSAFTNGPIVTVNPTTGTATPQQ